MAERREYRKPPITEAVIAFHLSEPVSDRFRDRIRLRLEKEYPRIEILRDIKVAIGPSISVDDAVSGNKLSSADGLANVIFTQNQLAVARLAPYTNWGTLEKAAQRVWFEVVKLAGIPKLLHMSTRYINRIDIPLLSKQTVNFSNYFNLSIITPDDDQTTPYGNFYLNIIRNSNDGRYQYNVKLASSVPALIDHASFILDIDISTIGTESVRPTEMWATLAELHERKNACFESYLKDQTRALFE